jgi:GT2 family glycosyltransferase
LVRGTLEALERQSSRNFDVIVVDQSEAPDPQVIEILNSNGWRLIHQSERGVARARNRGWREAGTDWVVFLDDDVVPDVGWAAAMADAISRYPTAATVMGNTPAAGEPEGEYPTVSAFPIEEEKTLKGRWLLPWKLGFTLNQAVRVSALERVGGFDERLGPGSPTFQASEDMDLNYRLLRAGEYGALVPAARAVHKQWRSRDALPELYERYMFAWAGFAMKHLRSGDVLGGSWLWLLGAFDMLRMLASGVRRRSRYRLTLAASKLAGLLRGTWLGFRTSW